MRRFRFVSAAVALIVAVVLLPASAQAYPTSSITLNGHGFGHGRGLSQYGSLGYALGGANYRDILQRYYSNTTVGSVGNPNIGVRIVDGDGKDLIVVSETAYSVGPVNVPAFYASRIRKIGPNNFAIDTAQNCAGGGGWSQQATANGPVTASTGTTQGQGGVGTVMQRCSTDTRGYRGAITAIDDGTQRAINNVFLNEYLRGVVPRESPASWADLGGGAGINALRAQSVAARSYAIATPSANWTTCDTISCQVYGGAFLNGSNIEDARTNAAINDTAGEVRLLNGQIARTEFSSSSGGYTAGGTFPAVLDEGDATPQNPNRNWSVNIAVTAVQAAYPAVGSLNTISVTNRNGLGDDGGRVLSMVISGTSGTVTVSGADFRARLGLKSDWFSIANSPSGGVDGYWMVGSDGGVFSFGNAPFLGSAGGIRLNQPIVGMETRSDNGGYWLVASDGGIFSYGSSQFYGSTGNIRLNQPAVGMGARPQSDGYWIVARDGGVFSYGAATFHGSTGGIRLNQPVVGMTPTPSGNGYWLVASDGGIFAFGDAQFFGSTGSLRLAAPIAGMASTPSGNGYWLVATDGGVFAFGDARFQGSLPGAQIRGQQATGITASKTGNGYVISALSGQAFNFGDAPQFGGVVGSRFPILGLSAHLQ